MAAKAKELDKDLFKRVRKLGVRRQTAREIAEAVQGTGKSAPKKARKISANLAGAVAEIQDRMNGGPAKRSDAAKKAARTRRKKARDRSEAAKKVAGSRNV